MNKCAIASIVSLLGLAQLPAPGLAQFIPPHSNDPHPPANQPRYQLPSPLSRPGVPQFPGAAHSNDPHYTKTEPRPIAPQAAPSGRFPATDPPTIRHYPGSTTPRAIKRDKSQPAAKRTESQRTVTLDQCYRKWDRGLGMSRPEWEASCRRLAASGRIRTP